MAFNPQEYFISLKGKQYLQVAHRLVWFREENPISSEDSLRVMTHVISDDGNEGVVEATIYDKNGQPLANARKREAKKEFHDYLEKAETGAIGRVLAIAGYGTQFAQELELPEEKVVDSPLSGKSNNAPQQQSGGLSEEDKEKKRQEAIAKAQAKKNQGKEENKQELANETANEEVNEITPAQMKAIENLVKIVSRAKGFNDEEYLNNLVAVHGAPTLAELTQNQAKAVITQINSDRNKK